MRRALFTLAALLLCATLAHATGGVLFARVDVAQVDRVTLVRGMGEDERDWGGAQATHAAAAFKALTFEDYSSGGHIQPLSWDFAKMQPRADFTPLAWMAVTRETREDGTRRYTSLSCYVVALEGLYECYYNYGSQDRYMLWHYNTVTVDRAELDAALDKVIQEEKDMDQINIWTDSVDWLNIVVNLVILVGLPLLGSAILFIGGAGFLRTLKALVLSIRFLFDDPTDWLIVQLAAAFKVDPQALADAINKFVDEFNKLPEAVDPNAPAGVLRK